MTAWLRAATLSVLLVASMSDRAEAQPAPAERPACPETGDQDRQLALALALAAGDGAPKNEPLARQCLSAAAEAGSARAQVELAIYLMKGVGGPPDRAAARDWLAKASSGSEAAAQLLAEFDRSMAAEQAAPAPATAAPAAATTTAARCRETDDPDRLLQLALAHAAAGGSENETAARACLLKAAEAGSDRARVELAIYLMKGVGGPPDRAAARDWLVKASSGSEAAAQLLAELDRSTAAVRTAPAPAPAPATAAPPAARCSDTDDPDRLMQLALTQAAAGGAENETAARACLLKAAEAGSGRARVELAIYMVKGLGGPVDRTGALDWLRRAEESGSETAARMRTELAAAGTSPAAPSSSPPAENSLLRYVVGGAVLILIGWVLLGAPRPRRFRRTPGRP